MLFGCSLFVLNKRQERLPHSEVNVYYLFILKKKYYQTLFHKFLFYFFDFNNF